MADKEWKSVSDMLRDEVRLAAWPIGVKMFHDAASLTEIRELVMLHRTAPCHMAARARYYREEGIVGASSQSIRCVWGAACLGMIKTPERLREGILYLPYTETIEAGKNLHQSIGMIGDNGKRYGSMIMAPLDLMPVDPDVIVMYLSPAQVLRFLIAYLFEDGEAIRPAITGQASLCASIAKVLCGEKFVVDIPCIGDRAYGSLQDHEMILAISPDITNRLRAGFVGTRQMGSYPFKPFLHWPVILRPDMESMPPDYQ